MPRLEAMLLRSAAAPLPLWAYELTAGREATLAQVAGADDGRGGLVTLGVTGKDVPESDVKNVSGHGYHALLKWDGSALHVSRRTKPRATTNGLLTGRGQAAPDEFAIKVGEAFRIARFLFTVVGDDVSAESLPFQTSDSGNKPVPVRPLPAFDPNQTAPDMNVSVAPDFLQGLGAWPRASSGALPALSEKAKAPDEVAVEAAEVLRTPLVDSDNVINGLLDIVDHFDPLRSAADLDDLFRAAVRKAVAVENAAADVVVIPQGGDPKPRGKDRLPWFSRSFVRDAMKKVGQSGGVLAGFWQSDAGKSSNHPVINSMLGPVSSGPRRAVGLTGHVDQSNDPMTSSKPGWAVCAPVPLKGFGDEQLALYVSAPLPDPARVVDLASDPGVAQAQKVVLLFAKLYGALDRMSRISVRFQEAVGFLPRPVQRLLNQPNFDEQLAPRTLDMTVLFCDLRGSCEAAGRGTDDLQAQWSGVFQNALEQMSRAINDNGGVIGGFIGDAVMGFWGWPDPVPPAAQVRKAAKAALSIRENFVRLRQHRHSPLSAMKIGIGLTHGPALVGKLGNFDMKKIDVFGPTVNRASRLEALTKRFGVEILIDAAAATVLGDPQSADARLRRLPGVCPVGMEQPFGIHELLPAEADDPFGRTEAAFAAYDEALREFEAGDHWDRARGVLDRYRDRDGPCAHLAGVIGDRPAAPADWLRDAAGKCYLKLSDK